MEDLEQKSVEELRELRARIDEAIATHGERRRREAMAAAEEAARKHGFNSLSELTGGRRSRGSRSASAPKAGGRSGRGAGATGGAPAGGSEPRYGNPDDPTQTWSGRGRRPRWFQEAIESGRSPEDFAL